MIKLLIAFVLQYFVEKTKSPIETKLLRFNLLNSCLSVTSSNKQKHKLIASLLNILYRRKSLSKCFFFSIIFPKAFKTLLNFSFNVV